jgi:hypothetical protein
MTAEAQPTVPPAAVALERLLRQRMDIGNSLLNLDMQERWGSAAQKKEAARAATALSQEARRIDGELTELVKQTARLAPGAIQAWAAAHDQLLARFLLDTDDDIARHVAEEERAQWLQVASGALPYVKRNVYYVRYDRELAEGLFGSLG